MGGDGEGAQSLVFIVILISLSNLFWQFQLFLKKKRQFWFEINSLVIMNGDNYQEKPVMFWTWQYNKIQAIQIRNSMNSKVSGGFFPLS